MARALRHVRSDVVTANLTPMIDVLFLLLVFFVLVSGSASREHARMSLSTVAPGAAARAAQEARFVLNVLPAEGGATAGYLMNGTVYEPTPDGLERLARAIAEGHRVNPGLAVNVRADRATAYRWVEPAMRAVTTAARIAGGGALPRMNLVVEDRVVERTPAGVPAEGGRRAR